MFCRGLKIKNFLLKIKIFILYLQFLFTYPFSLLIIHWIMISWWKFKLSATETLQIFLLMTSNWMILLSDETLTRKGKKIEENYTLIFLIFYWKIYSKIFYWKLYGNRKGISIFIFWMQHYYTWLTEIFDWTLKVKKISIALRTLRGSFFHKNFTI